MQHTAHQDIETRLNMWKVFFETGHDATPDGATDDEYGLDQLVELAFESDSARLHDLASLVEIMGVKYNERMRDLEEELEALIAG